MLYGTHLIIAMSEFMFIFFSLNGRGTLIPAIGSLFLFAKRRWSHRKNKNKRTRKNSELTRRKSWIIGTKSRKLPRVGIKASFH